LRVWAGVAIGVAGRCWPARDQPAATGQQPLRGPQPAFAAAPKKKPEEHGLGPALRRLFSAN